MAECDRETELPLQVLKVIPSNIRKVCLIAEKKMFILTAAVKLNGCLWTGKE